MDVEKAARAFKASLVSDLHAEYEEDAAQLRAQYEEKLAIMKAHLNVDIENLEKGLADDPVAWMAKYYPTKTSTATQVATAKKRDRSPATNGVVSAIDGAADEQPPKRGRLSEPVIPDHGTETRPKRTVRQAPSRDYADITNSAPLNLPAPTASDQPTDLQFAAYLLTNLCNSHLHAINHPFLSPVSVASRPDYHDTIKSPMDLETMSVKLSGGKYSSSEEMKKDFELMIQNCNEYNPVNHPIRDCGIRLRRYFEEWWNGKERWERSFAREVASKQAEKDLEEDDDDDDHTEDGEEDDEIDPLLLNAVPTGDREIDAQAQKHLREEIAKIKARGDRREAMEKEKAAEKAGKVA